MSLENLKPCRSGHAVKEASLTVFLNEPLQDFEDFESLMGSGLKDLFSRFEIIKSSTLNVSMRNEVPNISATDAVPTGFKFVQYVDGKAVRIFQGVNEETRFFITFHELAYERWKNFNDLFQKCFIALSEKREFNVKAFSLHFLDEFEWDSAESIPYREIFKKDNYLIPECFLESTAVDFLLTRNRKSEDGSLSSIIERIQINGIDKGVPKLSKLTLSHNVSEIIDNSDVVELINSNKFIEKVQRLHLDNKKLLGDIFVKEILDKVKLHG